MSVNSNLLGMQGPNLSNPCASPQVQPMHSEAKMVNNSYNHPCVISRVFLSFDFCSDFQTSVKSGRWLCLCFSE